MDEKEDKHLLEVLHNILSRIEKIDKRVYESKHELRNRIEESTEGINTRIVKFHQNLDKLSKKDDKIYKKLKDFTLWGVLIIILLFMQLVLKLNDRGNVEIEMSLNLIAIFLLIFYLIVLHRDAKSSKQNKGEKIV